MKTTPKLVLALLAVVSCAAGAETYSSDQQRRERNREEALAHYRAGNATREDAHDASASPRHGAHKVVDSTREAAHKVANEGRRVGHKVAVKARETTDRADAKFGAVQKKDGHGEASNPTGQSNTAANGPKP